MPKDPVRLYRSGILRLKPGIRSILAYQVTTEGASGQEQLSQKRFFLTGVTAQLLEGTYVILDKTKVKDDDPSLKKFDVAGGGFALKTPGGSMGQEYYIEPTQKDNIVNITKR